MDSDDHPVVQQGIKAAELLNDVQTYLIFITLNFFSYCLRKY